MKNIIECPKCGSHCNIGMNENSICINSSTQIWNAYCLNYECATKLSVEFKLYSTKEVYK